MQRSIRKQTQADFHQRVSRIGGRTGLLGDIAYVRDYTPARPMKAAILGFGWIYLVAAVARNREFIAASLREGSLPSQYHDWVFHGLAVLLAASLVLLAMHVFRFFCSQRGRKKNSGGVLIGAGLALTLYYSPAGFWQAGFDMLDTRSQQVLVTARSSIQDNLPSFPTMTIEDVAFVSSDGQ